MLAKFGVGRCLNEVDGFNSALLGGYRNKIVAADWATLGAGQLNTVVSKWATIAGGYNGLVQAKFSTVVGGSTNVCSGRWGFAVGKGATAMADHSACFSFNGNDKPCSISALKTVAMTSNIVQVNGKLLTNIVDAITVRIFVPEAHDYVHASAFFCPICCFFFFPPLIIVCGWRRYLGS